MKKTLLMFLVLSLALTAFGAASLAEEALPKCATCQETMAYIQNPDDAATHILVCVKEGCAMYHVAQPDLYPAEAHAGGTATCQNQAVCAKCQAAYGSLGGHDWNTTYSYDGTNHWLTCKDCTAIKEGSTQAHSGGTATCKDKAKCSVCGQPYGELSTEHVWDTAYACDKQNHWIACTICGAEKPDSKAAHTGGKATCTEMAVCEVCAKHYGSVAEHTYKKTKVVEPTCKAKGYTLYTCAACKKEIKKNETAKLLHWFGLWTPNNDGTHTAACKRDGCGHKSSAKCAYEKFTLADTMYQLCPVCGDLLIENADGSTTDTGLSLDAVSGAKAVAQAGKKPAKGEMILRMAVNPLENTDIALALFSLNYEYAGKPVEIRDPLTVSMPWTEVSGAFTLERMNPDGTATTIDYTLEDGVLTFTTDAFGIFEMAAA